MFSIAVSSGARSLAGFLVVLIARLVSPRRRPSLKAHGTHHGLPASDAPIMRRTIRPGVGPLVPKLGPTPLPSDLAESPQSKQQTYPRSECRDVSERAPY